ncbi:MAG TPA: hypothetical protein VFV33_06730 [Gemmatimonadaceae bacterium]|nr:hypothetical protein [Gemmatimonadaceae bacterium]
MRLAFATHRALPQLSDDDRLAVGELRQQGVTVESAVWDSPLVDWTRYDGIVVRSTWDYHLHPEDFEGWLARVERLGIPIWNPAPLLRWNMDKRYLLDLADRGVSTVPTAIIDRGTPMSLADVIAETGWDDVVFKPSISASGYRTARAQPGAHAALADDFATLLGERDVLVQPFIPAVVEHGEWSLVFLAGQYSHAVRKRSPAGEFRVQHHFGGSVSPESPRAALIEQGEAILSHLPGAWLYARVDACEAEGSLMLMELEMVEPELFLAHHPSAPRRFAAATRQLVARRRTPVAFTPRSVTPPDGTPR